MQLTAGTVYAVGAWEVCAPPSEIGGCKLPAQVMHRQAVGCKRAAQVMYRQAVGASEQAMSTALICGNFGVYAP